MKILQLDLNNKKQMAIFLRGVKDFGIDFYNMHRTYYKELNDG
jgi:hypothetical protein